MAAFIKIESPISQSGGISESIRTGIVIGAKNGAITFETIAGTIGAHLVGENVQIAMSAPYSLAIGAELLAADERLTVHFINTGVPHAVVFVEDLEKTDIVRVGAALRYHAHFAPKGTNANFAAELPGGGIAIRTYERGVENETLACGTGVTAAALIFSRLTGAKSPVSVHVRGGDTLHVGFENDGDGWRSVTLTGPADFVFEGDTSI